MSYWVHDFSKFQQGNLQRDNHFMNQVLHFAIATLPPIIILAVIPSILESTPHSAGLLDFINGS